MAEYHGFHNMNDTSGAHVFIQYSKHIASWLVPQACKQARAAYRYKHEDKADRLAIVYLLTQGETRRQHNGLLAIAYKWN